MIYTTSSLNVIASSRKGNRGYLFLLLGFLLLFFNEIKAQTPNWAWGVQLHGNDIDPAEHLDTDNNGNTLVAGIFSSFGLEIQDTTLVNEPYYWPYDAYLSLINSDGSLRWAKRLHAEKNEEPQDLYLRAAIFDAGGDVYLLGDTYGSLIVNDTLIGLEDGGSFTFLIELSPEGNIMGFTLFDSAIGGFDLSSDEHGGVYLSGDIASFVNQYDFNGIVVETEMYMYNVVFLAHYINVETPDWVKLIDDYVMAFDLYSNRTGDVCFTGSFTSDEINIDTFHLIGNDDIYYDYFAGKCNINGQVEWASTLSPQGGALSSAAAYSDGLYLSGYFNDPFIVFLNDTIFSTGSNTRYLAHISDNGELIATNTLDGVLSWEEISIAVSPHGELFVGRILFDSLWTGSEILYEQQPYGDPIVLKYNDQLEQESGFSLPMSDISYEPSVDWDAFGNLIYLSRLYGDTLAFGADTLINVQLSSQPDPILARSLDCSTIPISLSTVNGLLFAPEGLAYQWYFNGGQIDNATDSYYLPQQSGEYTVRIELENGCFIWGRATELAFPSPEDLNINVFPNPALNLVNVVVPAYADQCTIYDVVGRKLFHWENLDELNATLNISTAGIYFAEVRYKNNSKTIKFVVL